MYDRKYCEARCFGTKEHKSNNRPNVLGQDFFEMHSRTEDTYFLKRSIVDFLFEKGINSKTITNPFNIKFSWMKKT